MNILFMIHDQLTFDDLGRTGHPSLDTPNFKRVADQCICFSKAYVKSPDFCGCQRHYLEGRYASSHAADWNGFSLRIGELALKDHLRKIDLGCWLISKSHMKADKEGMERPGLPPDTFIGVPQAVCRIDAWILDNGLWSGFANAGNDGDNIASGWIFSNTERPANTRKKDSETPWLTTKIIKTLEAQDEPWLALVSDIKPIAPYHDPAPHRNTYGPNHARAPRRHDVERVDPHPVFGAWQSNKIAWVFHRGGVRENEVRAYVELINQCDNKLGRLRDHLETDELRNNTMIVLTSDHGECLGDRWMGGQDLFRTPGEIVPQIIFDPRPEANAPHETTIDMQVESVDLTPTFVDAVGDKIPDGNLEGRSQIPWVRGETSTDLRRYVISEIDTSVTPQAAKLELEPHDDRLDMVYDDRFNLMHTEGGFWPILFDLYEDPNEFHDLGKRDTHSTEIDCLCGCLAEWEQRLCQRVARSEDDFHAMQSRWLRRGSIPFMPALVAGNRGRMKQRFVG